MKSVTRFLLPLTALVALAVTPLFAAETVELKQRWIAGKQYFMSAQTAQQSTIEMGPQKIEQATMTTMEMSMAVRRTEDGKGKRMTLKFERVAMEINMNGQKMGFDSAKPGEGTDPLGLAKSVGASAGKELKVLLNDNDEIVQIENYDEFIKEIAPSPVPGMDAKTMFSKESLGQMMKQGALQALPAKPVAPGDSWPFTNEIALPQLGKVAVRGTYTFKGMGQHDGAACAEILADATIALDFASAGADSSPQGQAIAQLGMKVSNGTLKGTVWFDPQLGMARDSQLVQEMTITMKNPANPSATLSVPMKQNISTTLTKIEDIK
jgi:hypothetical protein